MPSSENAMAVKQLNGNAALIEAEDRAEIMKIATPTASAKRPRTEGVTHTESTYCPYNETSKEYDQTRVPLGVGCMLGSMARSEWALGEQRLLDVGGGTGTFLQEVQPKFKDATLFEVNDGMLRQAKANLGDRVTYQQGSADRLVDCFAPDTFHAVTMNQVIHHFPTADNYAFLKEVFAQIYRVTAPGGAFVLNHSSNEQHRKGFCWLRLMPKACDRMCEASPPLPICIQYMREVGFVVDEQEICVPLNGVLMRDSYSKYGLEGAFMKSYRDGDSGWSMGEKTGELEGCQQKIRELQEAGKDADWWSDAEAERRAVGQTTFITARKLAANPANGHVQ